MREILRVSAMRKCRFRYGVMKGRNYTRNNIAAVKKRKKKTIRIVVFLTEGALLMGEN